MTFTVLDAFAIGVCLEGLFYGLYSGIFAMFLQDQVSNKGADRTKNSLFYPLCALYILSVVGFVLQIMGSIIHLMDSLLLFSIIQGVVSSCCNFISQSILIYRCWIVWDRNIRVVMIPSILAFTFLVTWIAASGSVYVFSDRFVAPYWWYPLVLASFAMPMIVNALVTGLIVFKIFRVYRVVRPTSNDQTLGNSGGRKLRPIILMLIDSGAVLFSMQLVQIVTAITSTDAALITLTLTIGVTQMLNGITPTIVLAPVSMKLFFYDEKSMPENTSIETLCFVSCNPNSIPETGSTSIVRKDDGIGVQQNDIDIQVVER